jgi:plastocyanin
MRGRARIAAVVCLMAAVLVLPSAASASTKTVYAGAPKALTVKLASKLLGKGVGPLVQKYSPAFLAFFNPTVTINQGDSVKWVGLSTNFHTVDLPGARGHDLSLFAPGATVTGVNDFAGNPFWFDGVKPSAQTNPVLNSQSGGHVYNGSKRIDSGLGNSNTLNVKFTKPGVYKYFCDIHPGMIGYVVVRAKRKQIPSAKQDAATLQKDITRDLLLVKKLTSTKVPANHVSAGAAAPDGVELFHFFPATLSVKAGTVVTFSVARGSRVEGHTASFGPAAYLTALSNSSSDAATQQTVFPSSNPALGPIQVSPTSHGNGFANTGLLINEPTSSFPKSEKIDFTTPGTYHFECLIHPFMTGTIIVH